VGYFLAADLGNTNDCKPTLTRGFVMRRELVKIFFVMFIGKAILSIVFGFSLRLFFMYFGYPPNTSIIMTIGFVTNAIMGCILGYILAMMIRQWIAVTATIPAFIVGFVGLICITLLLPIIAYNYFLSDYTTPSLPFSTYFYHAVINIYALIHFLCIGLGIWLYSRFNQNVPKRKNVFLNPETQIEKEESIN
jgi:hypothetical protein